MGARRCRGRASCQGPWPRRSRSRQAPAAPPTASISRSSSCSEYARAGIRGPYTRPVSRRQLLTLIATILGSTVVFLDSTVVNVALLAISAALDAGLAGQQWVIESYMLTLVALLLVGGSLGDQFGRRRMFVFGLIAFGVTSALCAVAPSVEFLIGARALQGVAGALLVPGSLAIVAATFEGAARGKAVGTWTAWTGIATVFGPAGGGALIGITSWRAIFWINLPLIAATIFVTLGA